MAPAEISRGAQPAARRPRTTASTASPARARLVIFGVTGDLSRKKLMPAVYDLANRGLLPPGFALVGFARRDWEDQDFAQVVHDAVKQHARTEFRERRGSSSLQGIRFVSGEFDDDAASDGCARPSSELDVERGTMGNHAFYLSIPPKDFPLVAEQLKPSGLVDDTADQPTAGAASSSRSRSATTCSRRARSTTRCARRSRPTRSSASTTTSARRRSRTSWRCASRTSCTSRSGTRNYVDHVQITMAEDIGVGGRAGYYDGIGAARDVIQNHLLQLLALTAMEEPISFDADDLRAEKEKVLAAVTPARGPRPRHGTRPVRGRLAGRREGARLPRRGRHEPGVDDRDLRRHHARDQHAALGGRAVLPAHRQAPRPPRHRDRGRLQARARSSCSRAARRRSSGQNALVIRVQPDEGVTIRFGSKVPGAGMQVRDVTMDFGYGHAFTEASPEAYERLILDVLLGDPPLFPRHEEVELSWKILDPIEEFWTTQGGARTVLARVLGPELRGRAARPRRPHLEAPMIVELPDTTVEQDLAGARERARRGRRRRPRPRADPRHPDPPGQRGGGHRGRERRVARAPDARHRGLERPRRAARRRRPPRRADPRRRRRRRERGHHPPRLRRGGGSNLESLVTGLLLPDAPVVAWWPDVAPGRARRDLARPDRAAADHGCRDQGRPAGMRCRVARRALRARRHRPRVDPPHALARAARRRPRPAAVRAGHGRPGPRRGRLAVDRAARRVAAPAARRAGRLAYSRRWSGRTASSRCASSATSGEVVLEPRRAGRREPHASRASRPTTLALPRRTLRECLAEELRRLDPETSCMVE